MENILDFLENYFWLLLGFASLWVVAWSTYFAWRRYRHGPIHPPFSKYDVLFYERLATGFSRKNLFTRHFGAYNSLLVRVLPDALLLEPFAYYKWLMPSASMILSTMFKERTSSASMLDRSYVTKPYESSFTRMTGNSALLN